MQPDFDWLYHKKKIDFFFNGKKQLEALLKLYQVRSTCKKHGLLLPIALTKV